VVHRDLKASNVMRGSRAIETDRTSDAGGGVHGTMGYIAPECFHAEKATCTRSLMWKLKF
jgi:serine/threonine protein kinase